MAKSKIGRFFRYVWDNLFWGLRNADEVMTSQSADSTIGTEIQKEVHENRVSKALLKGEITEEVKQLRYRTYKVDREAKSYQYFSPTLAKKLGNEKMDSQFITFEDKYGVTPLLIQPNFIEGNTMSEDMMNETFKYSTHSIINIERDFVPRYKFENFAVRLVVFLVKGEYKLDFYFSIYPNSDNLNSKGFVNEVKRIKDDGTRSDILDIKGVSFTTCHAWGVNDMLEYSFKDLEFTDVTEFDGHYIIHYNAKAEKEGNDVTSAYYNENMEKKYREKEKKDVIYSMDSAQDIKIYHCEECGKEIIYDPMAISRMNATKDPTGSNVTEYLDMQVAEQTMGKRLCRECLEKYYENNGKNTNIDGK